MRVTRQRFTQDRMRSEECPTCHLSRSRRTAYACRWSTAGHAASLPAMLVGISEAFIAFDTDSAASQTALTL
jgi:hypothetical protein